MQGRENSAESRMHLAMARALYPGKCGYSSETGGIMKNLRESTNNNKVRNYHKDFYRPENLKVIITGQVKPRDVFRALEKLEDKILSKVNIEECVLIDMLLFFLNRDLESPFKDLGKIQSHL